MKMQRVKASGYRNEGAVFYHLAEASAPPRGGFIALVPGAEAPMLPLDLPPGLKGPPRERVARRQLADSLGSGGTETEMRPVIRAGQKAQWDKSIVVSAKDRGAWCEQAQAGPGTCRAILPDYLALPAAADVWTVNIQDGLVCARLGLDDGFSAEPALAVELLKDALDKSAPAAVLRLGADAPVIDGYLNSTEIKQTKTPEAIVALGLARPQILAHGELALDLTRAPGAEANDLRKGLRPFLAPAVMVVLGLGAWAGSVIYETGQLREQALAHRRNAEQILRDTIIPTGPILDIRAQVSGAIDKRRTSADEAAQKARPLEVFRAAGEVISGSVAQVTAVSYQPVSGLLIDLRVADFAALDQLVADLRANGLKLTVAQSTARENQGVEATLALASDFEAQQ